MTMAGRGPTGRRKIGKRGRWRWAIDNQLSQRYSKEGGVKSTEYEETTKTDKEGGGGGGWGNWGEKKKEGGEAMIQYRV